MNKPKFSIVIITKNEEKTLPKLNKSLKEFLERGGEVVLVDTGSSDSTVKLAKEYGYNVAEVGEKFISVIDDSLAEKINSRFVVDNEEDIVKAGNRLFDFAAARNYATSLASNNFIITLDADEAYSVFNIDKINELIDQGYEQLEYSFCYAHDHRGNPAIEFIQSKAFDRRKVKWVNKVHEVLSGENAKRILLDKSICYLEHWQEQGKEHRGNYLVGLALDCLENPENDRNSHYLGRELLYTGRYKSAIKELKRHIEFNAWPAERAQSAIFVADAYGIIGNKDEQTKWYSKAYDIDPNRRESLIKLAQFYQKMNNHRAANTYAEAALTIPFTDYYANDMSHYKDVPHAILYHAKGWLGDIKGAQEHIMKALDYQPQHPKYLADTKYYFEYPDQGIEGWMTFRELQFLYDKAKLMNSICEIGSWRGRSTCALLSGLKNGKVTAVDTFLGSSGEDDIHSHQVKNDAVYKDFINNTKDFNNLIVKRTNSLQEAINTADYQYDMIFIDASHQYIDIKKDLVAWKNKAKRLICGHDFCDAWPGVKQAVKEEIGEIDGIEGTIWYKFLDQ